MTRAPPFSYRKNQCLLATRMRTHLLILTTFLIWRDLRNLLIKHVVRHHKWTHANTSSITNRYQFILNCVFSTRLCASGDVDVWRSNEQCITCCYDLRGSKNCLPLWSCYCHVTRYPGFIHICERISKYILWFSLLRMRPPRLVTDPACSPDITYSFWQPPLPPVLTSAVFVA